MSLGDRMKRYEAVTRDFATPRMPLMVRVDGRSFHTFTKKYNRPFDKGIMNAMVSSALSLANEMQGFKAAYIQSDEATFCITDYNEIETQGWFGYNLQKITSISASIFSVNFIKALGCDELPVFDSRAFNIPREDVVNNFLWRAQDWERNSLQMYARSFFSHKELNRKNKTNIHDMLHSIGKNWTIDLTDQEKNGTFLIKRDGKIYEYHSIKPNFDSINDNIKFII